MTLQELKKLSYLKNEKLQKLEKLPYQGFCNINYKLISSKKNYLIRVFKNTDSVNISRDFEYKIQKKASKLSIAPKPLFIDKNKTFMITEFVEGHHKDNINKRELKKLIKTIKKLHKINSRQKPYELKKDLKNYKKVLKDKHSLKLIEEIHKELKRVKKIKNSYVTCHHDLNTKNIMFLKNSIKFVDWEYTGKNTLFFDLATICVEFKIKRNLYNYILKHYFKKIKKEHKRNLLIYIKIYKNICKLWFKTLK